MIALSYDLEMCAGYSPTLTNHGQIMPDLQKYTLQLCDIAESFNVRLHFFYVANGLENPDKAYLREILQRGHVIDSHTYSHICLATPDLEKLDQDLRRANRALEDELGIESVVLRGPGGILNGLNGHPESQKIILKNGFHYVSSAYKDPLTDGDFRFLSKEVRHSIDEAALADAARLTTLDSPYRYETGLIELPLQGLTDRNWFDTHYCFDPQALNTWRENAGHRPVAARWRAPWTAPGALDGWLQYQCDVLDNAYAMQTLWLPVWHPYSHYLHDPENIVLKSLLSYAASKSEKVWVGTLRDVIPLLHD